MELITPVYGIWESEFILSALLSVLGIVMLSIFTPFKYPAWFFGSLVILAGMYSLFSDSKNASAAHKYRSASAQASVHYYLSPERLEQYLKGCEKVSKDNPTKCYLSDYSEPNLTELQQKNIQSVKTLAVSKMKGRACLSYPGYLGAITCTASNHDRGYGNLNPRPLNQLLVNESLAELVANNPEFPSVHYGCKANWLEKPVYAATRHTYYEVHLAHSVTCERLNGGKPMDEATFSKLLLADLDRELPNEVHAGHVRNLH